MKVGMIFECGPEGADKKVCEYLAMHIVPETSLSSRTLDNKENLLRDAGKVAAQLLKDGCACVLIIWDLRPAWPDRKHKPCRHAEREALLQALAQAGVKQNDPVYLICIEQELESWLLACHKAINSLLSTDAHKYSTQRVRKPDKVMQPKAKLIEHFKSARNWTYDDKIDALRVLHETDIDLKSLRRSASFSRFEQKLGQCCDGA